jgi:AcrR family transcriptional regulator
MEAMMVSFAMQRNLNRAGQALMKHKSQSVSKRPGDASARLRDARVARIRQQIDQAFVALLFHRSYRSLRVSDITRKAGVGRATFYAHFRSKDELLRSQVSRILMPMLKASPGSPFLLDCRGLFIHVRDAPQLFRSIMGGGEGSGAHIVRGAMEDRLDSLLSHGSAVAGNLPTPLVKRFVISTLLTVISQGLQPNAADPGEEMQRQFEKLVGSGLSV